jgi:hypothetical protein
MLSLTCAACLLGLSGCFSADPKAVMRGVKSLEPDVEKRDRQIEELTNPAARPAPAKAP